MGSFDTMVFDSLVHEAWIRLWGESDRRVHDFLVREEYNRRLGDYNANISLHGRKLVIKYNLNWKNVDKEIKIGLIQHLLVRMFYKGNSSQRPRTFNIDLYNDFCKQIPSIASATVDTSDNCSVLLESFNRVNLQFFGELVDEPKLVWGSDSVRKLASYNFHTDTISVSTVFKASGKQVGASDGTEVAPEILDLLMYHELLHKVHGFHCKNGRTHTHTPAFKRAENLYPSKDLVERHIAAYELKSRRGKAGVSRKFGARKQKKQSGRKGMLGRLIDFLD